MEEIAPIVTLRERAACTLETINTYLAGFNGDGILRLFESDTDKNKYLDRYSTFTLKLNDSLVPLENSVAAISRLIAEYEAAKALEEVAYLYSFFESCELFLSSVSKFIESNEINFKGTGTFNPAHTLKSARELKSAAETLIESING